MPFRSPAAMLFVLLSGRCRSGRACSAGAGGRLHRRRRAAGHAARPSSAASCRPSAMPRCWYSCWRPTSSPGWKRSSGRAVRLPRGAGAAPLATALGPRQHGGDGPAGRGRPDHRCRPGHPRRCRLRRSGCTASSPASPTSWSTTVSPGSRECCGRSARILGVGRARARTSASMPSTPIAGLRGRLLIRQANAGRMFITGSIPTGWRRHCPGRRPERRSR